ncbi:hypothetical protein [Actinophytocola algeriensis]|uniref:Uncharacterized protein n=1 Tax=Actinophytocola algeriensis TaxID=1768010 RepID=A0A7W7VJQ6_9PSEU|nr:hypothetical protein [Actinophytocola algeriensis]MBB4912718.1 hypothetical protein [Actinophytocola algeriensis]MBE1473614.1 hypothetical protein [Actinophytocola algeriensis]
MTASLRAMMARDVSSTTSRLRQRLNEHGTDSVRALIASIVATEEHRNNYCAEFGPLGAVTQPVTPVADGFQLPTVSGRILIRSGGWQPHPEVTYVPIVEYIGLQVIEPNETYDDPYVIFSVTTLNPNHTGDDDLAAVAKIGPLDDIAEDAVVPDTITIWEDRIVAGTGIKVTAAVFDQDLGDPDEVREKIEEKVKEYARKGASAIATAFGAGGDEAGQIAGSELVTWGARIISLGIVELFGLGDDVIGRDSKEIGLAELVRLHDQAAFDAAVKIGPGGMKYTHTLEAKGDGHYIVYFRVRSAKVGPIEPPPMI